MAAYKYSEILVQSTDGLFDLTFGPGAETPHSGIYGCIGCKKEIASNGGNPLPPQNHHQHAMAQGGIRWKLRVAALY